MDLLHRFRAHLLSTRLFDPPGLILAAVSGGADSLAMLHLLHTVRADLAAGLAVVHVDHGIHPDSAAWAATVARAAGDLDLPCTLRSLRLGPAATETTARDARYRALRQVQDELGASYLATGHHAGDQAETFLFRVFRGSGPAGLAGIGARGPSGLRRPLLPYTRAELAGWLAGMHPGVKPIADPANEDSRHDRVWLREAVLPLLRARWPRVDADLVQTANAAAADRLAWELLVQGDPALGFAQGDGYVEVERAPLAEYDNTLSVALLRAVCRVAGCRLRGTSVGALTRLVRAAPSGRTIDLGHGWRAQTVFGRLRIAGPEPALSSGDADIVPWGASDAGEATWYEWGITWCREPACPTTRSAWHTWISSSHGAIRALRRGDRMRPLGAVGRRPVRRLLMEARVPLPDRARYPIVVCGDQVVWIPGICRGDAAVPRPGETAVRLDVHRRGRP
jgi:tRNA(Ile)-lysidine synthase